MSITHEISVPYRTQHLGQYDRIETCHGRATVKRMPTSTPKVNGKIQFIDKGLIVFELDTSDLQELVELINEGRVPR